MKDVPVGAADRLVAARRSRQPTPGLPEVVTFDDAYAVQAAFRARWRDVVVGHKVGCSSEQSQRLVNSPGPIAGSLFRAALWQEPATLERGQFFVAGVEAEFGFRLGADLPSRTTPYGREEVGAAVDAVVPVIEICDTRLADWRSRRIEEITRPAIAGMAPTRPRRPRGFPVDRRRPQRRGNRGLGARSPNGGADLARQRAVASRRGSADR